MKVLLLHLDGALPNFALMRLAAHHRAAGDLVELRRADNGGSLHPRMGDPAWDRVYGSLIFERTRPLAETARTLYPGIVLGGTGWDLARTLESVGVDDDIAPDYTDYPRWRQSMGFTQRGCRMTCKFCVVPRKEGKPRSVATIAQIWRGEPHPRELLLLDNDFFGNPDWPARIDEIRSGRFRVCFTQGINARTLTDEAAAALASVNYRDDSMKTRRLYTAWDNAGDEDRLFAGLEALVKHGVRPRHIMVYMLIGFWRGETHADRDHRRQRLRDFGALPFPMPFTRDPELVGFQRWVIKRYDTYIPWHEWAGARFSPRRLGDRVSLPLALG